ncbi:MAG TPA: hypothetical protein EYN15_06935 [Chromatiales bacterium]|nr:hypothetical protein [Chromatiales bacterium]
MRWREGITMLNPDLDWAQIREDYVSNGFVRIHSFLQDEIAEEIHQCLAASVDWKLCMLGADGPVSYTIAEMQAIPPAQHQQMNAALMQRAANGFSYMYQRMDLVNSEIPFLKRLYDYISGEAFVGFAKYVTDELEVNAVNGQASCYRGSSFLKMHNDDTDKENRKAAYVMGFSKGWRPDWGGLLHVLDKQHNLIDVQVPVFNSMTIFRVPTPHFVSQVANYAQAARYTVNGWFIKA